MASYTYLLNRLRARNCTDLDNRMKVCATRLSYRSGQRETKGATNLAKPRDRKYESIDAIATVTFDRYSTCVVLKLKLLNSKVWVPWEGFSGAAKITKGLVCLTGVGPH
jgi:hypothetical protein